VLISLAGIAPLLEAVSYLLAPHLAGMPVLTRVARRFLCLPQYPATEGGES